MPLDKIDKELLNIIQADFPIDSHPYEVLGERLGISADEALDRVRELVESGIIRKIGSSFDTRKVGHVNALAAACIPDERLHEVADIVSSFPQVTHNYGRKFKYNLWFTLVCQNAEEMEKVIRDIKFKTGISDIYILPSLRMFKIRVNFEF